MRTTGFALASAPIVAFAWGRFGMQSNNFLWDSSAAATAWLNLAISSPIARTCASTSALGSFFDRSIPICLLSLFRSAFNCCNSVSNRRRSESISRILSTCSASSVPRVASRSRTNSGFSRIRRMSSMWGRYTDASPSKQEIALIPVTYRLRFVLRVRRRLFALDSRFQVITVLRSHSRFAQPRNSGVTLKFGRQLRIIFVRFAVWHLEIKNAHPKSTNSVIGTSIGCPNHHGFTRRLLFPKVDHHVGNRNIPIDLVRARPEHEIARLELVEFERFCTSA